MTIALIGYSIRENELRRPIHPKHLSAIPQDIKSRLTLDEGYGTVFGVSDDAIKSLGFAMANREELLSNSDIVILPKPMEPDLEMIKEGAILWGWLHFVLYGQLADICIRRKHTVVTWEAMFESDRTEGRPRHTFSGNNELAGYAGVLHAIGLQGLDGIYGSPQRCVVIGHGYAGRASVLALKNRGFENILVLTQRSSDRVHDPIAGVEYRQMVRDEVAGALVGTPPSDFVPAWQVFQMADIIVNCGGQDPEDPLMYVLEKDNAKIDHHCLVIDISCDPGMGFSFLRTTQFENPTYKFGDMTVCAVDHSPGYLWDACTWQISGEVMRYLHDIVQGMTSIMQNQTLSNAIEIQDGVVTNPKILSYQKRLAEYPHPRRK